ncbi:MAG: RNA polymerase sigma factor [Kineosporiaceae bacterium]|nr:RNA polymerase sigma factor [Aeromicrobium sp.]
MDPAGLQHRCQRRWVNRTSRLRDRALQRGRGIPACRDDDRDRCSQHRAHQPGHRRRRLQSQFREPVLLPRSQLVRARNRNSAERLTEALTATSPDLLRYFQRRLPIDDAADGLAELMLAAWRRVDSTPPGAEQSRMWLFGIARHVITNAARSEHRRRNLTERFREVLRTSPTEGRPADDGADVRDAIGRLSPAQAELVRLIHWDGFAITEAAQILNISPSTARTRYQRARTDLKTALSEPAPAPEVTGHLPITLARPIAADPGATTSHRTIRPVDKILPPSQRIDISAYPF